MSPAPVTPDAAAAKSRHQKSLPKYPSLLHPTLGNVQCKGSLPTPAGRERIVAWHCKRRRPLRSRARRENTTLMRNNSHNISSKHLIQKYIASLGATSSAYHPASILWPSAF